MCVWGHVCAEGGSCASAGGTSVGSLTGLEAVGKTFGGSLTGKLPLLALGGLRGIMGSLGHGLCEKQGEMGDVLKTHTGWPRGCWHPGVLFLPPPWLPMLKADWRADSMGAAFALQLCGLPCPRQAASLPAPSHSHPHLLATLTHPLSQMSIY